MGGMSGLGRARAAAVTAAFLAMSGPGILSDAVWAETNIQDLPFAVDKLLEEPAKDGVEAAPSDSADPADPVAATAPASAEPPAAAPPPSETGTDRQPDLPPAAAVVPGLIPQVTPPVHPLAGTIPGTLERRLGFKPESLAGLPWSREAVERFYALYGGRGPVWTGGGPAAAHAPAVLALMIRAGEEGLDPADYPVAGVDRLIAAGDGPAAEVLLTDAVIRYAADRTGARLATVRLPAEMRELGLAADAVALAVGAARAADPAAALAGLGPQDAGYTGLRRLLAHYRDIARAGGWAAVPTDGPKIEPGQYDPRLKAIRIRLSVTDGIATSPSLKGADFYDPALLAAVERFQSRHGLTPDGVIGKNTLREMAREPDYRIRQIIVNLERRRQRLDGGIPDGIVVNLPEFTLRYWEQGRLVLTTPVIVGRVTRKSPLLAGVVSSVVINPTWTVPSKLAGEDIVRHVLENPNYIEEHGFTIYSGWGEDAEIIDPATIDWASMPRNKSFPFRLRQRPGADNSLGQLKINFANKYAVYMHDTPDRHLFAKEVRAISSGCVRVMNPLNLVERLLAGTNWSRQRIEERMGGELTWLSVRRTIPVRFTYVTAWVDDAGIAHFRDDFYGIDKRIAAALGHPIQIAAGSDSRPIAAVVP